ncbi:AfsR/SARP family transcriptional regulator [Streptomyces beigongshangae]|uniref:AfsR/SARP family transcriptional regulator n=1 Tax=Streptomyces beigongshangae TaxID=2841597 RepID=UPI0027E1592C|nr:BTAD domain-containing putative transcriptional regulator [Streptomyces sp. REN17]
MQERLRFSVLGPVRAWHGPDEIELGPAQQRAVLAVLLLAEGSQVTTGGLVDAVWGGRVPVSALGNLRTYVHGLRKALESAGCAASSVIRSTGDGYQLRVPPQGLDLGTFQELLAHAEEARRAGDAQRAAVYLRDALGLWQGTALAGMRGEYAHTQRQRLGELRLSAQTARSEVDLDLGRWAKAASELTVLVAEHPLDERLRELLMLALYRSGRQAAALTVYREVQTLLADELGVDPGPALRAIHQRVLRADTGLLAPPSPAGPAAGSASGTAPGAAPGTASVPDRPDRPAQPDRPDRPDRPARTSLVPAQLPAALAVFVGRDAELAEVARLPSDGTVVVSAIAGMAGVGKTTFAVHWARQVAHRFPDGQLYLNLRGFDPSAPPMPPEHALRTLLESLGADTQELPQDVDALAALYRTLLTGRRVLVLLDNARDAAQVRPLLPGAPGCLVIVTSRNRLAGLVAVDGARPLRLDVLSVPEARALLVRRLGPDRVAAEPEAVEEIIARCARLPLALAVTAARAATRSAFPLSVIADELRDSAAGLDVFHDGDAVADVRAVFSWSCHTLTPDAARLFRLLALHPGPDIALPAAAALTGLTATHTGRLMAELVQAHLVDETAPGRYASHDLLRAYAAELVRTADPDRQVRAARHRMFDHYLRTAHEAVALKLLTRVLIDPPPAVEGARAEDFGGDTAKATAWFAAEQAVLLAAVEQAAVHRYDVHCWQLAWALTNHLHWRGLWREQEQVHRTAMEAALRLGDRTARAHAHCGLGWAAGNLGRFDEARGQIERAVELFTELGDMRACAECCRTLAWVEKEQGDLHAALDAARRFLTLRPVREGRGADGRRDRMTEAAALNEVGGYLSLLGRHQQALDHCRRALALCQELGYDTGAADTWAHIGHAEHHLGRYEQAVTAYRNALETNRQGDFPLFMADTLLHLGDAHLSAGRPDAAGAAWAEALDVKERLGGHADTESLRTRLRRLDEPGSSADPADPAGSEDSEGSEGSEGSAEEDAMVDP